jgi:hypothetical protein
VLAPGLLPAAGEYFRIGQIGCEAAETAKRASYGRPLEFKRSSRKKRKRLQLDPMPAVFNKLGIKFQYPDNWSLDEQDALEGEKAITVYSPGGSFWSVAIHPFEDDPDRLCKAAVKAMRQVYDELDSEEGSDELFGRSIQGYDMNFYCLDLTNTALVRGFRGQSATYVILCQADDREFTEIEPVFRAMTASFVMSEGGKEEEDD